MKHSTILEFLFNFFLLSSFFFLLCRISSFFKQLKISFFTAIFWIRIQVLIHNHALSLQLKSFKSFFLNLNYLVLFKEDSVKTQTAKIDDLYGDDDMDFYNDIVKEAGVYKVAIKFPNRRFWNFYNSLLILLSSSEYINPSDHFVFLWFFSSFFLKVEQLNVVSSILLPPPPDNHGAPFRPHLILSYMYP